MRYPMEHLRGCLALLAFAALAACSTAPRVDRETASVGAKWKAHELARGLASWYGPGFHGKRTANGERYDMNAFTAAHRTLPFGTQLLVRNMRNGREVVVRINDRGPRYQARIIDLSKAAAASIGLLQAGEAPVVLSRLEAL